MFTAKANDEGSEAATEKRHPHSSLSFYEYLGEGAAQFDVRRCRELSLGAHGERAGVKAVQVGHDQQQVRRGLYWQEAAPRHVDAQSVVEAFDGGADRRLQLDDVLTAVERLTAETRTGEETCWVVVEKYLILSHVFFVCSLSSSTNNRKCLRLMLWCKIKRKLLISVFLSPSLAAVMNRKKPNKHTPSC